MIVANENRSAYNVADLESRESDRGPAAGTSNAGGLSVLLDSSHSRSPAGRKHDDTRINR
jgi:hypothetical protein